MASSHINVSVDYSLLEEIMARRNALNRRGRRTPALDAALNREADLIMERRCHIELLGDDGSVLVEYAPSGQMLEALAGTRS